MVVPGFLGLNSKLWSPFGVTVMGGGARLNSKNAHIYVRNRGS